MWVSTERSYRLIQTPFKSANKLGTVGPSNVDGALAKLFGQFLPTYFLRKTAKKLWAVLIAVSYDVTMSTSLSTFLDFRLFLKSSSSRPSSSSSVDGFGSLATDCISSNAKAVTIWILSSAFNLKLKAFTKEPQGHTKGFCFALVW